MAEDPPKTEQSGVQEAAAPAEASPQAGLESGTYEIIRNRLLAHGRELRARMDKLNAARKQVYGSIDLKVLACEHITTANNCVPRDVIPVGDKFIFGYNVFVGMRSETLPSDVFSVYLWKDGAFEPQDLSLIGDEQFKTDFGNLYRYYRNTVFSKFSIIGPHLFMVFQVGKEVADIKTFKWLIRGSTLQYLDNRSDHEYVLPPQHSFEWKRATRDMQVNGDHPHISIEDKVFVETIGGDLTIKVENNTATGEGIYNEPVDSPDQTMDDAEIHYAVLGNIILLKIRPYQEPAFRYIVYNQKTRQATRIDSIEDACILLSDDHGIIFPRGYYLQTGDMKLFDGPVDDMVFDKCIASPNGEDFLYAFYNRAAGLYILLSYNMISQQVQTPIFCDGFSLFEDGTMVYFRADGEPKKHHALQVWQTPYRADNCPPSVLSDSYLYKIGNKDVVRCLSECNEVLGIIQKEDTYANLYADIAKGAQAICDSYHWLASPETFDLAPPLQEIRNTARTAIGEFEKVVRTKAATRKELASVQAKVEEIVASINYYGLDDINEFVRLLAALRAVRGQIVSCRDLRYVDLPVVEAMEKTVSEHSEKLSGLCVEFLLKPAALEPYRQKIAQQDQAVGAMGKVAQVRELEQQVSATAGELELLVEIVSNLKIADATVTTAIIDSISLVYSRINQVRSALKNKLQELAGVEGRAEFAAQTKLIDQAVTNYLDVSDTPEKVDGYLTRLMVQIETLEGRFADFDEFVVALAEKREEIYSAMSSRKVQLVEARNRRASTLMTAAQRVLKGIKNRAAQLGSIDELNGYFASDVMIERVRETITQLGALGDTVKADDVSSQLKSLQQDAVRQFKDRQGLFEDGENVIRLGKHRFNVNRQELGLTIVNRDGRMCLHLAGTGFFEEIADETFLASRDVWDLEVPSESRAVYRAEYLAYRLLGELVSPPAGPAGQDAVASAGPMAGVQLVDIVKMPVDDLTRRVQGFMSERYAEGYVKGVHDHDAAVILRGLAQLRTTIGLLRFSSQARAAAALFWHVWTDDADKARLAARLAGFGMARKAFGDKTNPRPYIDELREAMAPFVSKRKLLADESVPEAAAYLFQELLAPDDGFVLSKTAADICHGFDGYVRRSGNDKSLDAALAELSEAPVWQYRLIRDWIIAYLMDQSPQTELLQYVDEAAVWALSVYRDNQQTMPGSRKGLDITGLKGNRVIVEAPVSLSLEGLTGTHAVLAQGRYRLDYCEFMSRLEAHEQRVVPRFMRFQQAKKELVERCTRELKLEEFQAKVLTTFVRNKLIDKVYLPLIGENLAKQIGTSDATRRTDRQGLLLLISPPGYGKTTLMEYVANRLGLIFIKINGPAVGSRVTSLDPAEAPNAAAREELQRLNLGIEMGDNVMLYVDDIQHCNPEFLQKFISLCDAQRRIEGVYKGRTRTYDLRGKRVCVVMAGNPYTESGQRFRIPDMLSNRADTYNIGDIVGDCYDEFCLSYIENCLTSNSLLARLATRSQHDVYEILRLAQGADRDAVQLESSCGPEELAEYVAVMRKLFAVRDVVLKVNQQYISSAGQEAQYRSEPPFLLQGSYRNMNRIAAKVVPVMNEPELWTQILSAYEQDAQTLAVSAEANLLKFKELVGRLSDTDGRRWEEIKKSFNRNQLLGQQSDDKVGMIIRQLNAFGANLEGIKDVLAGGVAAMGRRDDTGNDAQRQAVALGEAMNSLRSALEGGLKSLAEGQQKRIEHQAVSSREEKAAWDGVLQSAAAQVNDKLQAVIQAIREQASSGAIGARGDEKQKTVSTLVGVLDEQFQTMQMWLAPVVKNDEGRNEYVQQLIDRFETMVNGYNRLIGVLRAKHDPLPPSADAATPASPPPLPPEPHQDKPPRKGRKS